MANMFDENGNYNKTEWKPGDRITAGKLNKIEESLEAINNNDIERHKEADERLDALEEQNEAVEERFDELEDLVADNKSEVNTAIYEVHSKMDRLEQEMNEGIKEVHNVAETVDGKIADADASMKAQVAEAEDIVDDKIAEADASMKAQVAEAEDIVNQGKADMEAMVAETRSKLDTIISVYKEISFDDIEGNTFKDKITNITNEAKTNNTLIEVSFGKYHTYDIPEDMIEIDLSYIMINGNSATFNYTGNKDSSYFINVIHTKRSHHKRFIKNLYITTTNILYNKIGVVFGGDTTTGTSSVVLDKVNLRNFYPAFEYRSHSYLIRHNECDINGGVNMPSGYIDYGENISFTNCTFHNTRGVCVRNDNANGDFRFTGCSFDYSDKIFECYSGGIVVNNSHIEFRLGAENENIIYNYEAFICRGSNARIVISNSRILGTTAVATGGDAINRPYIFKCDGGDLNNDNRASIELLNCSLWGLKSTTGELCSGNDNGLFIVKNSHGNRNWECPIITKKNNNLNNYSFDIRETNCTHQLITDTIDGKEVSVYEFTVTNAGARVSMVFPTDCNVSYSLWFKNTQNSDCWTQFFYENDTIASIPSVNTNSVDAYTSCIKTSFYKPTNSRNNFIISMNRGLHKAGSKFYICVEHLYEW